MYVPRTWLKGVTFIVGWLSEVGRIELFVPVSMLAHLMMLGVLCVILSMYQGTYRSGIDYFFFVLFFFIALFFTRVLSAMITVGHLFITFTVPLPLLSLHLMFSYLFRFEIL